MSEHAPPSFRVGDRVAYRTEWGVGDDVRGRVAKIAGNGRVYIDVPDGGGLPGAGRVFFELSELHRLKPDRTDRSG